MLYVKYILNREPHNINNNNNDNVDINTNYDVIILMYIITLTSCYNLEYYDYTKSLISKTTVLEMLYKLK
jgi:hypothetical protein